MRERVLRRLGADGLTPLVLLLVCVLAFGLQIPWLGYYLDDWIILHALNIGGAERIFEYAFLGNRPLVFWLWWGAFRLLGSAPLEWHIWALLWRWLAVVMIWLGWRRIWPRHAQPVALAAVLFAVYPTFRQQPTALTYSFHWICFFLFGLSVYSMIRAVQNPHRYLPWSMLAVLSGSVQLFSQEFYVGLELLRPVLIWLALKEGQEAAGSKRLLLAKVIQHWLPYLILLIGYVIWRFVVMPTPGSDRNTPDALMALINNPLAGVSTLVVMFAQDVVEMLAGIWYKTYRPDLWTLQPLSNIAAWAVALVTLALLLLARRMGWAAREEASPSADADHWDVTAAVLGFAAMIAGFLPGWAIGRHIYDLSGIYNDRFGLAAMPGAALLVVALCRMLLKRPALQVGCVLLLVALASGHHFRTTTDYRWSWERQRDLFWQLKWRAPALQQPTAILADGALVPYIGSWATISALEQMYAPAQDSVMAPYWYLELPKFDAEQYLADDSQIVDERNFLRYQAPARSSVVIDFQPDRQQCLWVLRPQDKGILALSENTRSALQLSNIAQILPEPNQPLRADIFGPEPAHGWCYYFEKADLARQLGDWQMVSDLWQQAQAAGQNPNNGVELIPFIEGFAYHGDWQQAMELTRRADFPHFDMQLALCNTWQAIEQNAPPSSARDETAAWARDHLGCP